MFLCFKKKTVAIAVLLLAAFSVLYVSSASKEKPAATKKQRILILKELGVSVDEESEKHKSVTVPTEFHDVYNNYNKMQNTAGYDLSQYKGVKAELYTYSVKTGKEIKYYADLLTYKGRLIGGDICSVSSDGQMVPLKKEEIKKCLKSE